MSVLKSNAHISFCLSIFFTEPPPVADDSIQGYIHNAHQLSLKQ